MGKSTKAFLLSMFVFPGAGHLYLKQYIVGFLLAGGAATATYVMVSEVIHRALDLAVTLQNSGMPADFGVIMDLVSQQAGVGDGSISIAVMVLSALWIFGILDSFRAGRKMEKNAGNGT